MMFVRAARDLEQRLLRAVAPDSKRRRSARRGPVVRREPAGRTAAGGTRAV
jgi:hypothetical protein